MKKVYGDLQVYRTIKGRRLDTTVMYITDSAVLNAYSPSLVVSTITSAKTLTVPGSGLYDGWGLNIHNHSGSSHDLDVRVGSSTIVALKPGQYATIVSTSDTPSSPSAWRVRFGLYVDTVTNNLNLSGGKITNLGAPVDDTDAATKLYVDTVANGMDFKAGVKVVSDSDLAGTYDYAAGESTLTTALTTLDIDGVTIQDGWRVLLMGQANPYENGIYEVSGVGSAIVFTRTIDANSFDELNAGAFVIAELGTSHHDRGFVMTTEPVLADWGQASPGGDMTFQQFGNYVSAGDGIYKSGDEVGVRLKGIAADGTGTLATDRTLDFSSGSLETRLASSESGLEKFNSASGGLRTQRDYQQAFNVNTDWGTASGGYYTIIVWEATHNQGMTPSVSIYEEDSTDFVEVMVDEVRISSVGDVSFRVPEVPDCRFAGKVVISHKFF
jgi:hypothetical protein